MYLQVGVFLLPCGWDASPSQGSPSFNSLAPICTPGWRDVLGVTCDGHLVQGIRNNFDQWYSLSVHVMENFMRWTVATLVTCNCIVPVILFLVLQSPPPTLPLRHLWKYQSWEFFPPPHTNTPLGISSNSCWGRYMYGYFLKTHNEDLQVLSQQI